MNTYKTNEKEIPCVVAADGTPYERGVAHPLPLPEGISDDEGPFNWVFFSRGANWNLAKNDQSTHWTIPLPGPEVPKPKTLDEIQVDKDEAWLQERAKSWSACESAKADFIRAARTVFSYTYKRARVEKEQV